MGGRSDPAHAWSTYRIGGYWSHCAWVNDLLAGQEGPVGLRQPLAQAGRGRCTARGRGVEVLKCSKTGVVRR
jgi:hypothetical protein